MTAWNVVPVALIILCLLMLTACPPAEAAKKKTKKAPTETKQVFIDQPELDEEEQKSEVMPLEHRCDACKAIANTLVRVRSTLRHL